MYVHFYCSEHPLDIDIVVPDSKVVRSGGRKRLFTSPMEELALEHGVQELCIKEQRMVCI